MAIIINTSLLKWRKLRKKRKKNGENFFIQNIILYDV
jgi:hypothetical protein